MSVKMGNLQYFESKSLKDCDFCEEKVKPKQTYAATTGRTRNGKYFTRRYHLECFFKLSIERIQDRKKNPKSSKPLTSRLQNLTPEQRRRRETLQTYLSSKDKVRLLKAYRSGDFNKIKRAYEIIAARWAELHQMGLPFRTTIIPQSDPKLHSDEDKELINLMFDYDSDWVEQFRQAETVEAKMLLLFRTEKLQATDTNMTEEEQEAQRIAREEYDRERIERAEASRLRLIADAPTSNLNEESYVER
jgi:hypothetical protein